MDGLNNVSCFIIGIALEAAFGVGLPLWICRAIFNSKGKQVKWPIVVFFLINWVLVAYIQAKFFPYITSRAVSTIIDIGVFACPFIASGFREDVCKKR